MALSQCKLGVPSYTIVSTKSLRPGANYVFVSFDKSLPLAVFITNCNHMVWFVYALSVNDYGRIVTAYGLSVVLSIHHTVTMFTV
jgi:hypothetical protein